MCLNVLNVIDYIGIKYVNFDRLRWVVSLFAKLELVCALVNKFPSKLNNEVLCREYKRALVTSLTLTIMPLFGRIATVKASTNRGDFHK